MKKEFHQKTLTRQSISTIKVTCEQFGLTRRWLSPYQVRIDGRLDLNPTTGSYHFLPNHSRGRFQTDSDLYRIIVSCLRPGN